MGAFVQTEHAAAAAVAVVAVVGSCCMLTTETLEMTPEMGS